MNMNFKRKLPIPLEVKTQFPLTDAMAKVKAERDELIKSIIDSTSDKFLLVIGPCSADREDSVMEYISRLRDVQEKVKDKIVIVPRIYTGKPRTTGEGYMGLLHQPDPSGKPDLFKGILAVRQFHMRALSETGFACADEMLYPENHRYLSDLLGYVAVGARSGEDQHHRLTASGINIPVGIKNPTGGDISVMVNSITAAQRPHTFIYRGWEVESTGNPYTHAILRGYVNKRGQNQSNYHYEDLIRTYEMYAKSGLANPAVIIDTNHANSGKQFDQQQRIAEEVLYNRRHNADIGKMVKGFMVESYLVDGCQKPDGTTYGQSITDPCMGWEKTEKFIYTVADKL